MRSLAAATPAAPAEGKFLYHIIYHKLYHIIYHMAYRAAFIGRRCIARSR
jgi:hypothetical protein